MTPHIEAKKEDIAKTVIMPGDPLRAKMIADSFLENTRLVNDIRGILAYTGIYNGKEVTVMASGMGNPSMGIYSYELYKFYDVDNIIRIGSTGAYTKELKLYDLILVNKSYSTSNYAYDQNGCKDETLMPSVELNNKIIVKSKESDIRLNIGCIHNTDVFYSDITNFKDLYERQGCLGAEMESFALFHNANVFNKQAACILTVSDNLETHEATTSDERQNSFTKMVELALDCI